MGTIGAVSKDVEGNFMKWSLIYLLALIFFWHQTDLVEGGTFTGAVAPLAGLFSLVAFLISLLAWFARRNDDAGASVFWSVSAPRQDVDQASGDSDGGGDGGDGG